MKYIFAFSILIAHHAFAHPVSYKDALGIMSYNSQRMNELLLTYSFSPKIAVAHAYLREFESEYYIPRVNFLVKRWNNSDSQGNVYLSGGSGKEKYESNSYNVHLGELVVDWENRKYYTYFEHLYLKRENDKNSLALDLDQNHSKLRLGFAPFLADYEDLNVWYIIQFERHNDEKQNEATQFLRFFRKNVLWEVGAGFDGSVAFNFMIHL
jgi:hypothetical protein